MVYALSVLLLGCFARAAVSSACEDLETCSATVEGTVDESSLLQRVKKDSFLHLHHNAGKLVEATSAKRVNADQISQANSKEPVNNPHKGVLDIEYRFLGCYPRSVEDTNAMPIYMDTTCINWTKVEPCRSGLPFYRLRLQHGQGFNDCFSFCNSKGLDLSGVMQVGYNDPVREIGKSEGEECRCGASTANTAAWHGNPTPPANKQLPNQPLAIGDKRCKLLVWQYSGGLEMHAMPYPLQQLNVADESYIGSIAVGLVINNPEDGPVFRAETIQDNELSMASTEAMAKTQGLCTDAKHTGVMLGDGNEATCSQLKVYCTGTSSTARYVRGVCPLTCGICSPEGGWVSCYPYKCAIGVPWTRVANGTVPIAYYFDSVIDEQRKAVFRKAVEEWEFKTCVRFYQSTTKPCLKVTITDTSSCTATLGNPGENSEAVLNMGWCRTMTDVGSIIHEIGHTLGMSHEQNRPDGSESLQVPGSVEGPYLTVYWNNIPDSVSIQYEPMPMAYIGSTYQGPADPYFGYAPYDYMSIMHYGRNDPARFDTVDPTYNAVVGQRTALSDGDVLQISDMYQCSIPSLSSTTAGPATTTQSPGTTTTSLVCQDVDPVQWTCGGEQCTCEWLQENNHCIEGHHGGQVRRYCPKSCGECPTSTSSTSTTTSSECKDGIPPFTCEGGVRCTCEWLSANQYCTNPDIGESIRASCPLSCGMCTTTTTSKQVTSTVPPTTSTAVTSTVPPTTSTSVTSTVPPTTSTAACQDGIPPYTCDGGVRCTCEFLKENLYCNHPDIGETVRESCPLSCGVCTTTTTMAPATTDGPVPLIPTSTQVTSTATPCQDTAGPAGWTCNGIPCTCPQVRDYCTSDTDWWREQVQTACPLTCGTCTTTTSGTMLTTSASTAACQDTAGPPGWTCNAIPCTCSQVQSYCTDDTWGEQVQLYCPVTCGLCGSPEQPEGASSTTWMSLSTSDD